MWVGQYVGMQDYPSLCLRISSARCSQPSDVGRSKITRLYVRRSARLAAASLVTWVGQYVGMQDYTSLCPMISSARCSQPSDVGRSKITRLYVRRSARLAAASLLKNNQFKTDVSCV